MFVDPNTNKLTYIIDWQSASVSEPFLLPAILSMLLPIDHFFSGPQLEVAAEASSAKEDSNRTSKLLSHYQNLSRLKNEPQWAAINLHNCSLLTEPIHLLSGAWSRNDVFSFQHSFIHLAARWEEIAPATIPCPRESSKQETELIATN